MHSWTRPDTRSAGRIHAAACSYLAIEGLTWLALFSKGWQPVRHATCWAAGCMGLGLSNCIVGWGEGVTCWLHRFGTFTGVKWSYYCSHGYRCYGARHPVRDGGCWTEGKACRGGCLYDRRQGRGWGIELRSLAAGGPRLFWGGNRQVCCGSSKGPCRVMRSCSGPFDSAGTGRPFVTCQ